MKKGNSINATLNGIKNHWITHMDSRNFYSRISFTKISMDRYGSFTCSANKYHVYGKLVFIDNSKEAIDCPLLYRWKDYLAITIKC